MKTSLVIATYNWPEALELVLLSLLKQSVLPNEILIADDGSTKETKQLIGRYSSKFKSEIKHICQKDEGFKKKVYSLNEKAKKYTIEQLENLNIIAVR